MSDIKLVVFDCDGVMFDSLEANREFYNHVRAQFNRPPMDEGELKYVHMHHVADSVRYLFRNYPEDQALVDAYRRDLDYTPYLRFMKMEPDLTEFLQYLRPARKTAISTNRTTTMALVLNMFNLKDYFDMVVTAADVPRPKPHPEALELIMESLEADKRQTIYIGDSQVDREHSAAAGVPLIAFKNRNLDAEYHVESFMEIVKLPPFTS